MVAALNRPLPKIGHIFETNHKGTVVRMTVIKDGKGIAYQVGSEVFRTPSAAGRYVTKGEVNGWRFWHME